MGLEKYNIAPDDKGGRPEKEEEEGDLARDAVGEKALTIDNDDESYWQEMYDEYGNITLICHHASVLPRTAKRKMSEHGIGDWDFEPKPDPSPSKSKSSITDKGDSNSGFAAIINDAK